MFNKKKLQHIPYFNVINVCKEYRYIWLWPDVKYHIISILAQLERQRRLDTQQKRCQSALVQPGEKFARPFKSATFKSDLPDSALPDSAPRDSVMSVTNTSFKPESATTKSTKPESASIKTDGRTLYSTSTKFDNRPATTPAAGRHRTLSPIRSMSPDKLAGSTKTAPSK